MALADLKPLPEPPADRRLKADAGVPGFGTRMTDPLKRIPNAGRFSTDKDLSDPVQLIAFLKAQPQILNLIDEAFGFRQTDAEADGNVYLPAHRPAMKGSWPLAFLAFVASTTSSIQKWSHANASSSELWRVCGFDPDKPPSYDTIRRRFIAMEKFVSDTETPDGFEQAKRYLIAQARKHEPQIGRALHFDGTAIATHAAFVHSCPAGTPCGDRQIARAAKNPNSRKRRPDPLTHGTRVQTASVAEINEARHEAAEAGDEDPAAIDAENVKDGLDSLDDHDIKRLGLSEAMAWWCKPDPETGVVHYYGCRDKTAAPRMYRRSGSTANKFWVGWIGAKAAEGMAGISGATDIQRADRNENKTYPDLMEKVRDSFGRWPQLVTGDRGIADKSVYEYNTARGIGSALPFRASPGQDNRYELEDDVVDRHGVPRCQHCGGPGHTRGSGRGFTVTPNGTPIVRFTCIAKNQPDCRGIQTAACSHEPRLLQPLRIDDQVYNQLRHLHSNREHVHLHERQRRGNGGRDVATRDHRIGIDWQRLRASAGNMLDWFCLCLRHGWFASLRPTSNPYDSYQDATTGTRLRAVLAARERYQLNLPYGPQAARLNYGFLDPPWITHPPPKRGKK